MRPDQALDRRADLAIAAFAVLALVLLIGSGTAGLRWLSARWNAACHHLVHAPAPPGLARPWRLVGAALEHPCPTRIP